jgi:hypothetical protein
MFFRELQSSATRVAHFNAAIVQEGSDLRNGQPDGKVAAKPSGSLGPADLPAKQLTGAALDAVKPHSLAPFFRRQTTLGGWASSLPKMTQCSSQPAASYVRDRDLIMKVS